MGKAWTILDFLSQIDPNGDLPGLVVALLPTSIFNFDSVSSWLGKFRSNLQSFSIDFSWSKLNFHLFGSFLTHPSARFPRIFRSPG